jgi:hypothetical protein
MNARMLVLLPVFTLVGCPITSPEPTLAEVLCTWVEHPANPLIEPMGTESMIADPTVLGPDASPDGRWHLFAHSLLGVHHFQSDDGIDWTLFQDAVVDAGALRPFLYVGESGFELLWEDFADLTHSEIRVRHTDDLLTWGEPRTLLTVELDWEQDPLWTIGNPYLERRDDQLWLYYSANGSYLPDTDFYEPRYIGLARADSIDGPWEREPEPLFVPEPADPWNNHGAGSIKLLDERVQGRLIALHNGIYISDEGQTGSAIEVLVSDDGLAWEQVCDGPVIAPDGDGWDAAFVYAFDTERAGDELRVYYNARDGWVPGSERIGLATLALPAE